MYKMTNLYKVFQHYNSKRLGTIYTFISKGGTGSIAYTHSIQSFFKNEESPCQEEPHPVHQKAEVPPPVRACAGCSRGMLLSPSLLLRLSLKKWGKILYDIKWSLGCIKWEKGTEQYVYYAIYFKKWKCLLYLLIYPVNITGSLH